MKIQVVDENDNLIGVKERGEIDYQKDIYRTSVLWLMNSSGSILLAKRALTKDKDPGKWGPAAAGTVDEGESYGENVYKEAEEEIGLTGVQFTLAPKIYISQPRKYFCQLYSAVLDREEASFALQKDEVEEVAWVNREQFKTELRENPEKFVPAMRQIAEALGIND